MNTDALILVAEDKQSVQLAIQTKLLHAGFRVIAASDGEEAMDKALKHRPQLILLDIMMPKKDGFEVMKGLQQHDETHAIPVVFLTNYNYGFMQDQARYSGAVDYLVKSDIKLSDLVAKVQFVLGMKSDDELAGIPSA